MPEAIFSDDGLVDLIETTQKDLGRLRFTQIAQALQEYVGVEQIMRKERMMFESGYSIRRNLMTNHNNEARMVSLFSQDAYNVGSSMTSISIPWKHTNTNYVYERRELLMNRSPAKIVDLIATKRASAMLSQVELMEDQIWGHPDDDNDKLDIYGIPFWIVKSQDLASPIADDADGGFLGDKISTWTAYPGGLNNPKFRNWVDHYGSYDNATTGNKGLVRRMRLAHYKTKFKSPISVRDYRRGGIGDRMKIYLNYETQANLVEWAESRNDALGKDIAAYEGQANFRRNRMVVVPKLDADTDNPVYLIDMGSFSAVYLRGDVLRESKPRVIPGQHNALGVDVDSTWNMLCDDRRRQAVLTFNANSA